MAFVGSGPPIIDALAEEDVPVSSRDGARMDCQDSVLNRAIDKRIISDRAEAVVRMIRPDDDLNFGSVTYEQWLTGALVAGTALNVVNAALTNNKVIGIFGFAIVEPNPAVSEFRFMMGPNGASQLFTVNIQQILANRDIKGYFSKMIGYDPLDTMYINLMPFLTDANGQIVVLRGYTAERTGNTISGPVI